MGPVGCVVWCFRRGGGVVGKLRCAPVTAVVDLSLLANAPLDVDGELGGDGEGDNWEMLVFSGEIVCRRIGGTTGSGLVGSAGVAT